LANAHKFGNLGLPRDFVHLVQYPNHKKEIMTLLLHNAITNKDELLAYLNLLTIVDLRAAYQKLDLEILNILGKNDAIIPIAAVKQLRVRSNTHVEIIANAGHAMFLTHQQLFVEKIETFLKDDIK